MCPELLAPAGNFISLQSVLQNGADAVYIGLIDYNMRANANNFTLDDLKKVSSIAQQYNAKTYLCSNIILNEDSAIDFRKKIPVIYESEIDGLILSDIGLIEYTVENGLEAHISVQENSSNSFVLNTLKKLGAKRAILSRELSLNQIKEITKKSSIETEVFIHGAMCMSISGRCFLSNALYGRSANCGDCLQPCRKNWTLTYQENENDNVNNNSDLEEDKESFIISGSFDNSYRTNFFSPKDLSMINHIPELIKAGIDSFKIEGRGRSPDYGAKVTGVYREAIDTYLKNPKKYKVNQSWINRLKEVFNRGFDTGFYFKKPNQTSKDNQSKYIKKDIGKVVNYYNKIKVAELKIHDNLVIGDRILIQGPTTGSIESTIKSMQINGENIIKANKGCNVAVKFPNKVRKNDFLYKLILRQ